MNIEFKDSEHEQLYNEICSKMKYTDCYHKAVAYLLSLDTVCNKHIKDLFDFEDDAVKHDGLEKEWQTGTSKKTTRLMFNLWNGYSDDSYYSVADIFDSCYSKYYYQAVKLRFEISE